MEKTMSRLEKYKKNFDETTIVSEAVEPTAAYLVGRWYAKCEKARKRTEELTAKEESGENLTWDEFSEAERFLKECRNFWWGVRALNRVSIACEEAVHFALACGNVMGDVARYIEEHLGIDPLTDKEWNQ
jgi:hypothetical protein